jgi:hypothetical protein
MFFPDANKQNVDLNNSINEKIVGINTLVQEVKSLDKYDLN